MTQVKSPRIVAQSGSLEIWVILFITLFAFSLVKITKPDLTSVVQSGQSTSATIGQCPVAAPTTIDAVETVLESDYGIHVIGNVDLTKITLIYNAMCLQYQSQTYRKLLGASTSNPIYVYLSDNTCGTGISGVPYAQGNICPAQYRGFRCSAFGWCSNTYADTFLVGHELANHIFDQNTNGIIDKFLQQIYSSDASQNIDTYNCRAFHSDPNLHAIECFTDMVGEYLVYQNYFHDCSLNPGETGCTPQKATFSNFPTAYPTWYNFAKTNIFDNLEFSNKP